MIYKKATIKDLDALSNLENQIFDANNFPMTKRAFRYHLKKGTLIVGAFEEERLLGYIMLFVFKKRCRIYAIGVSREVQKRGIGKALINEALRLVEERDLQTMFLEVREDNTNAIKAYEAMGFKLTKVKPSYYPDGMNGLRMELTL